MQTLFEQAKLACDGLAALMLERGFKMPQVNLEIRSNVTQARILLRYGKADSSYPDQYQFCSADTPAEVVEKAEAWIMAQPTAEERKRKDALELTAKALEAARDAGMDTGEGAAFVTQLEAMMKRLAENAITDQSEAS